MSDQSTPSAPPVKRGRIYSLGKADDLPQVSAIERPLADQHAWDEIDEALSRAGALEPTVAKDALIRVADNSGVINECIAAYRDSIEGYGYTLVPEINVDSDGAAEQVRDLLWVERRQQGRLTGEPTEAEIEVRLKEIRQHIRWEKARAERFFRNCARDQGRCISFVALRKLLRDDLERTGEAYVEVLYAESDVTPRRLSYVPSVSMRKLSLDSDPVKVKVPERVSAAQIEYTEEWRYFRRFVQIDPEERALRYFKQFGDPRLVSSTTGMYYESLEDLQREEGLLDLDAAQAILATELLDWELGHPLSVYGMPRWMPNTPAVRGTREADETNLDFFESNGIPALAVLVAGGELGQNSTTQVQKHFEDVQGRGSRNKVLVLEAAPYESDAPPGATTTGGRVTMALERLSSEQLKDAIFASYVESNEKRTAALYRVPPLLRGRADDYTRATAGESIRVFEELVAQPERGRFDDTINTQILPALGITLLRYTSRGPDTSDVEATAKALDIAAKYGAVTPTDLRPWAEKAAGYEMPPLDGAWANQPLALSQSAKTESVLPAAPPADRSKIARQMRQKLAAAAWTELASPRGAAWLGIK